MPVTVVTATIPAGQSLSDGVDVTGGRLVRIETPAGWTPTPASAWEGVKVSFQSSLDNIAPYRDLYTRDGEFVIPLFLGVTVAIITGNVLEEAFLKIRAGTSKEPLAQAATRTFNLYILR